MTEGRKMEQSRLTIWIVLSVVGLALVVWGIASGSVAFILAPAVLTVGCLAMAVMAARKGGSVRRS